MVATDPVAESILETSKSKLVIRVYYCTYRYSFGGWRVEIMNTSNPITCKEDFPKHLLVAAFAFALGVAFGRKAEISYIDENGGATTITNIHDARDVSDSLGL